jgi:hypothetical protein
MRAAQGQSLPLAIYNFMNVRAENVQQGRAGLLEADVLITVHATTYDAADTLAWQIVNAMDRTSGTYASEVIKDIRHMSGPEDLYQDDADVYGKIIEFKIWVENANYTT